jgi:scyllo-inositol 2-dehydrogenase (NADP+)
MKIRCGVIGFGMAARTFHIPFIRALEQFELSAISTSRGKDALETHPGIRHYAESEALLADPELDLIVITSPNDSHYPLALQALQRGYHVLVEKPFTLRGREATRLVEEARRSDKMLTVFHNRRRDADFLSLQELIASGRMGRLTHFESRFDRFRPNVRERWREADVPGAGLLYDLGSHLIDQTLCLFGMPDWIQADVERQRSGAKADDYVHLIMGYDSFRAELHMSSFVNGPLPRLALHGEGGSFIKYGLDAQEDQLKSGLSPLDQEFGQEDESNYGTFYPAPEGTTPQVIPSPKGDYAGFYSQLAAAIAGQKAVPVPPEEAARVIDIIELAQKSAGKGRRIRIR